jgi:hypothetical protein
MYTNVNLAAPVGVLLLLATGFLLFVAALALGYSLISKKFGLTFPSTSGQGVLENSHAAGTPITTPLQPSQTYTTTFVFDLPTNIRNPTLLIHEGDAITSLIIGHENSFLHKKTRFQI